jgi:hypothetical protein
MRYEVRFNNGYWSLFDTIEYYGLELFHLKVDAEKAAAEANEPVKKERQHRN